MTFWELVTGNSSLPIAPENTFWDHINNQQGGGSGTVIISSEPSLEINNALTLELDDNCIDLNIHANIELELDNQIDLELDNDTTIV